MTIDYWVIAKENGYYYATPYHQTIEDGLLYNNPIREWDATLETLDDLLEYIRKAETHDQRNEIHYQSDKNY